MKKFFSVIFFIFFLFLFFAKNPVSADDRCYDWSFTDEKGNILPPFYKSIDKINYNFKITGANQDPSATYDVRLCSGGKIGCSDAEGADPSNDNKVTDANNALIGIISNLKEAGPVAIPLFDHFEVVLHGGVQPLICRYPIDWVDPPPSQSAECQLTLTSSSSIPPITLDKDLKIEGTITNLKGINKYFISTTYGEEFLKWVPAYMLTRGLFYNNPVIQIRGAISNDFTNISLAPPGYPNTFSVDLLKGWPVGQYTATAKVQIISVDPINFFPINVSCNLSFTVPDGVIPTATPIPTPTTPAICTDDAKSKHLCSGDYADCPWCPKAQQPKLGLTIPNLKPLCDQLGSGYSGKCWECQKSGGIWSAIGCLPTNLSDLIKKIVFPLGLGIAGGSSFLYFLYGAFMILTSSGNAETIEEAKQIITSALAGLLLIIFSIFILKVIGVDILQLPGFK